MLTLLLNADRPQAFTWIFTSLLSSSGKAAFSNRNKIIQHKDEFIFILFIQLNKRLSYRYVFVSILWLIQKTWLYPEPVHMYTTCIETLSLKTDWIFSCSNHCYIWIYAFMGMFADCIRSTHRNLLFFYLNNILFQKWIGQQAYKPIICPLLLLVGFVKHKIIMV